MNDHGQRLQQAISRARAEGRVKVGVWVLLRCGQGGCESWETNVWVQEQPGSKAWQAPARCVRCATPLEFQGLESEHGRPLS
jgi:hypothetical protein